MSQNTAFPAKLRPLLYALLSLSASSAAWCAEEEDLALVYGDKETVSIATGSKQDLRRAPAVATVITSGDIAAMGATDLDEALESVAGMHVSNIGSRNISMYQFRGIGTVGNNPTNPEVLMLQNGIPMNTLYRGDKGEVWSGLPLENVARIEVIRGPGSALYGADAYSGVINIITKTAADISGTQAGARVGSFNTWNTWVQHGGSMGALDVAAYFRVSGTNGSGQSIPADAQTARDQRFHTTASLAPGSVNNGYNAVDAGLDLNHGNWRLRAGYRLRDDLGTGTGVSSALDPAGHNKSERINADISWNDPQFTQNWELGITLSALHYEEQEYLVLAPPGSKFSNAPANYFPNGMIGGPSRSEQQWKLSAFATYSGLAGHRLRLGMGSEDLDLYDAHTLKNYFLSPSGLPVYTGPVSDYTYVQPHISPHRRTVNYLYVQDEWEFARDWALTAGIRQDQYSDFGGTTNPRLALVWNASLDLTAKLLYGRAFRAPSFTEQYGVNPVSNGNPALRPETIQTLEAAFAWQARKDTQLHLSLFHYRMENIIRTVTNPSGIGATFQNSGGQHGNGMELETTWSYSPSFRLTGNYSYQKSIDDATGKDAGYAPHHHVYLRGDWRYPSGWFASAQLNYVADRMRSPGDTRPAVPDYTTVDITARSPAKGPWEFSASIRNLFNADAREPSLAPGSIPYDLPVSPRMLWMQATYKLQ